MPLGCIAIQLERYQGHSARIPAAHFDEFVYSGRVTLPEELDQLRLHRHSAISPLGCIAIRLERHQGHSAKSPAAHFNEFVYSERVTLPEELDQLRLHRHSAISPLGCIAIRLERYQGHSARSPAAHFDEFVYSGQVTLPEELDQLRLHRHSAISPLGCIVIQLERHQCHSARSPAAHFDELVYSGHVTLPEESNQLRQVSRRSPTNSH